MKVVYSDTHREHDPQFFLVRGQRRQSTEQPERADRLLAAVEAAGHERVSPPDYGTAPAAAVHSKRYLDFLEHGHSQWRELDGASSEILPHVHPPREESEYPASVIGRAGFHISDTSSPIGAGTWRAAVAASHSACHAATLVLGGEDAAYSLSRPPGHHAGYERAGGFCYINNAAVAAQWLRNHLDRVAILDVDVHHGNGTQEIFYSRADVLHVSLHADPAFFYPFFTGYASETGKGEGLGYNVNIPMPLGTDDSGFLCGLEQGIERIATFRPDALVVALGLDAFEGDPLHAFDVTTAGFAAVGERIGKMQLPTVFIQEGGYLSEELGLNLSSFLSGFLSVRSSEHPQ